MGASGQRRMEEKAKNSGLFALLCGKMQETRVDSERRLC